MLGGVILIIVAVLFFSIRACTGSGKGTSDGEQTTAQDNSQGNDPSSPEDDSAFFSKDVLQMVFPVDMSLHKKSKRFDIAFDDGQSFSFSFEFRSEEHTSELQSH